MVGKNLSLVFSWVEISKGGCIGSDYTPPKIREAFWASITNCSLSNSVGNTPSYDLGFEMMHL